MAHASRTAYLQLPDGAQFVPQRMELRSFDTNKTGTGTASFVVPGAAYPAVAKWTGCKLVFDNAVIEDVTADISNVSMWRYDDYRIETVLEVVLRWGTPPRPRGELEGGE